MRRRSEQAALLTPTLIHHQESFVASFAQHWRLWVELQPSDHLPATQPKHTVHTLTLSLLHTEQQIR